MKNIADISVIICAYTEERWDELGIAIESILKQNTLPREIIVVIDHNARLLERAKIFRPGIIVTENSEQRGLAGARNSGVALAQGTYIAFLDDDARAEPDWILQLSRHCTDPQVLGVGGKVEPQWLEKQPAWFPEEFYWVVGCSYLGLPKNLSVVRNLYGGCACIRRDVFEVVGGFKNTVGRVGKKPMGGEETELCIRATMHWPQKSFLYEPDAKIHHLIPPSRACWHYFLSRCYAEGLSKAAITGYVGAKNGLASERSYTLRTLPLGVFHGLVDATLHRDPAGLARAAAIICGLLTTAAGYLVGKLSSLSTVTQKNTRDGMEAVSLLR